MERLPSDRPVFIQEILDLIDGPGPDVVKEIAPQHLIGASCPHCQTIIAESAGVIAPKPIQIRKK